MWSISMPCTNWPAQAQVWLRRDPGAGANLTDIPPRSLSLVGRSETGEQEDKSPDLASPHCDRYVRVGACWAVFWIPLPLFLSF